ncbi:MAG: (2Fe-2S)-binding protein [Treponema sp.]|jgi:iron only hydrogenase large subunit-like protein|nr:(2Fe-2S)-binding protein [Treponema sp.]
MSHHQPGTDTEPRSGEGSPLSPNKNVTLTIDGISVTVPEGTRILEAAKKVNVNIPTLCEHPDLCKRALCRICVVEADGRGKLIAACANDVWEGVSIITANQRLLNIRKTIIELILANHPQDCLSCIRNKKCELQSLALSFGVGGSLFDNDAQERKPQIESETLVRDMDKCVKCGRCVEACQEVQTIRAINTSHRSHEYEISTPYKQALKDGPCVFCGQCAAVCPVGAIYEHDQTAEVRAALNDNSRKVIAQVSPAIISTLNKEFAPAADEIDGKITAGKIAAALKLLGFDRVYDASIAANAANSEISGEAERRTKNSGKLPIISGCSQGVFNFIKCFYPDLTDHLTTGKNFRQIFASSIKNSYSKEAEIEPSNITSVSFVPCIAQKYEICEKNEADFALTAGELARMIKLAGIAVETLSEGPFASVNIELSKKDNPVLPVKKETVHGYAQAHKVMEAIRKGECDAQWVEIESCPVGSCS